MEKGLILLMLLVGFLTAFLVEGKRYSFSPSSHGGGDKKELTGPRGVKVIVNRRGGSVIMYREMPSGQQDKPHRKTGQLEIRLGRIQENNCTELINGTRPPGWDEPPRREAKPEDVHFRVEGHGDRNVKRKNDSEIRGECLILKGSLKEVNDSVLTLTICILKGNGSIENGDEETEVSDGQLKFSIQLDGWPWSDGQCLDVDVIMKVPSKRKVEKKDRDGHGQQGEKRPRLFSLGYNATATYSGMVEVDGDWKDMSDGFPSGPVKRGDGDYVITLRFPRFNSTVFYDLILDANDEQFHKEAKPPPSGAVNACASLVALLLAFIISKLGL